MRRLLIMMAFPACLPAVHSQSINDLSFGTDSTFEVLTWNLEWFAKNEETTVDYVAEILSALDADLIALQEIDKKSSFERLVDNLDGYEGYFTDSDYLELGYVYKSDALDVSDIFEIFPNTRREFPREPLVMEMAFRGKEMVIINNHLKCCGDGILNNSDSYDQEKRRLDAMHLLYQHINAFYPDMAVILLGDMNDILTDSQEHNIFNRFIDDEEHFMFTDMEIARGSSVGWSYPTWPSHLDHILITNELFDAFKNSNSEAIVLKIEDYLQGGWDEYDAHISDHRPVGLKLFFTESTGRGESMHSEGRLHIYPNPVVHSTTIAFATVPGDASLTIYDATGKMIDVLTVANGQASVLWKPDNVSGGFYFVELMAENKQKLFGSLVVLP